MFMKHLAIFSKTSAQEILSGKKKVEVRFSKSKIAPFGEVSAGDLVYIKPMGGEPIGQFKIEKVIFYDGMNDFDIDQIKNTFGQAVNEKDLFWKSKLGSKYGTLIFIGECIPFLTSPIKIKKKEKKAWVLLNS